MSILDGPAQALGCTSAALRLLIGVLMGYPLAFIYRNKVRDLSPTHQHAFFATTGMALVAFNYGWDIVHSITNILVVYAVMVIAGRTKAGLAFNFIFTLSYLLVGYLVTATENYDIKWTMPHCILCLRLIGVAFDYYDGQFDKSTLSVDQKATCLTEVPPLLEMFGHSYFFGGCMVGPQFPLQRYRQFVQKKLFPNSEINADSIPYGFSRLGLGIFTMAVYQIGSMYVNDTILLSPDFLQNWGFSRRWLFLGIYGTITLHKYVSCWLMAEGSCALVGLSYNGKDANGKTQWDGLCNIGLWHFESTTNFDGFIRAFNINTNKWVGQYVFKRLRFLGNKDLSQVLALMFLAIWHGFHFGYYVCFFNEFIVMKFERDMVQIIDCVPPLRTVIYHPKLHYLRMFIMKLHVACLFGYCLVPFTLLSFTKFRLVYGTFYWLPNILLTTWFFAAPVFVLPHFKRRPAAVSNSNATKEINGKMKIESKTE